MIIKETKNNKTTYSLTRFGISIIKSFVFVVSLCALCFALAYTSVVEARTKTLTPHFSLSNEEIAAAKEKAAEKADIIMTAEEFLGEGERAADFENIHEYLQKLKENGLYLDKKDQDSENTTDDQAGTENIAGEETDSQEDSELAEDDLVGEVEEPTINKEDWRLILVNKQNPVPTDYDSNLANINGSMQVDARIVDDVYEMLEAAKGDGVDLMICSAYRSYDRQTVLFNNKMNKLMNKGMSYMEAYAVGSMSVTVPGTSEHQLGLALDILTGSYTSMDDGFGQTKAGIWLKENAPDYGFILRYPAGKEEITGIIYEPWHFRYVGKEYSKEITDLNVCLEEYLNGEY